MKYRTLPILLLSFLAVAAMAALPLVAEHPGEGGRPLSAALSGTAEVPGPGDPDGAGEVSLTVNPGQEEICYELSVTGVEDPTAAHIHDGAAGVSGPPVVTLEAPAAGSSSDCVQVERELAKEILKNPSEYYVNVHNDEFPAGAVRGQLST